MMMNERGQMLDIAISYIGYIYICIFHFYFYPKLFVIFSHKPQHWKELIKLEISSVTKYHISNATYQME